MKEKIIKWLIKKFAVENDLKELVEEHGHEVYLEKKELNKLYEVFNGKERINIVSFWGKKVIDSKKCSILIVEKKEE